MKMAMWLDYKPTRYEGKGFLRNLNIRIHRDITGGRKRRDKNQERFREILHLRHGRHDMDSGQVERISKVTLEKVWHLRFTTQITLDMCMVFKRNDSRLDFSRYKR